MNNLQWKFTAQLLNDMVEKHVRDPQIILKWLLKFFQNFWKSFGVCLAKLKKNISTKKIVKNSLRHVCQTRPKNKNKVRKILHNQTLMDSTQPRGLGFSIQNPKAQKQNPHLETKERRLKDIFV